jgi:hypothetical protein
VRSDAAFDPDYRCGAVLDSHQVPFSSTEVDTDSILNILRSITASQLLIVVLSQLSLLVQRAAATMCSSAGSTFFHLLVFRPQSGLTQSRFFGTASWHGGGQTGELIAGERAGLGGGAGGEFKDRVGAEAGGDAPRAVRMDS